MYARERKVHLLIDAKKRHLFNDYRCGRSRALGRKKTVGGSTVQRATYDFNHLLTINQSASFGAERKEI
jgi:hypothetical protein